MHTGIDRTVSQVGVNSEGRGAHSFEHGMKSETHFPCENAYMNVRDIIVIPLPV